jgi:hypothetical protein
MKLTPLLLFLLILVVLVIAVITLKNPIAPIEQEGFVQFKTNVVPQTETVIPAYSSHSIVKLYDNLFIDRINMNIVEVIGDQFSGTVTGNITGIISGTLTGNIATSGNVDLTGASIDGINIQKRDGTVNQYINYDSTKTQNTDESKISSISSSNKAFSFTSVCNNTARYQLFYISWDTNTYIHAIQLTANTNDIAASFKPLNLCSYYIPSEISDNMSAVYYTNNNSINLTGTPVSDTSDKNGTLVTESWYSSSRQVYQLSSDIKYDIKSGNLIVNDTTKSKLIVYDRSGTGITITSVPANLPDSVPNSSKSGWTANNTTNTILIVYLSSAKNTVILLLQKDTDKGGFKILKVVRFNETSAISDTGSGNSSSSQLTPPTPGSNLDPSTLSEYYKWYWYWNSAGPGTNAQYSNNYLLKTQIVPPVCPSCPSATCASTASSVDSSSKTDKDGNIITDTVDTAGNVVNKTVDTAGNVVNKSVDTAGNLVNKTIDAAASLLTAGGTGATNVLTSGASGATNLLTSGASGATNLLTSGASGATDLLKSGASGTAGLLRDAGSGAVNVVGDLTSANTGATGGATGGSTGGAGAYYGGMNTPYGSGSSSSSGYSAPGFSHGAPPTDNYSYYGALPNKGSNYIPITADFSAFKK